MGQALYRKHRPKKLSEVVGQEHITSTLEQALKQGRISHAYLFTGPRGVGKTSIARILAHEINSLPYDDDSSHIDIIEIDAASNRRIDEIRELRDKVYVAPTSAKYKVYIIDEVHMLTREAFNALLKTLEEPPEHVVFILATTDAHKLPETIVSRTQRFSFKPVEKAKVIDHLREIAKIEGLKVSDDALELLADHGEGSFRDSISLLDQATSHGNKVEIADVERLLGIPSDKAIKTLLESLSRGASSSDVINQLNDLYNQGYQASAIAKQLGATMRSHMIDGSLGLEHSSALELMDNLVKVPISHDPERYLEIVLLHQTKPTQSASKPKTVLSKVETMVVQDPEQVIEEVNAPTEPEPESKPKPKKASGSAALDDAIWPEILAALKKKYNTLYGVVRMAQPSFEGDTLNLTFAFAFHEKRLNESTNRQKISNIIEELTGKSVNIECFVDKNIKPPKADTAPAAAKSTSGNKDISAISNIFGGGELLES
ncbi:MAG: DNA polymerase III subunit gamma/tau [Candidatus Saccharimonadales bacterium]